MEYSIFITGAAQGIGAATARLFYQAGYKVGLYDIQLEAVQALAHELGERAKAGQLDVSNYQQWQSALHDLPAWAGTLNILVNNAGILYSGAFEKTEIQAHHRTIDINIKGVLNGCHAALPFLKQADFARVINLSSASAIYGQADLISYSASKFAVRGITEGLDVEWRKYKIRVFDIMPLFVHTNMVHNMDAGSIQNMGVNLTAEDVAQNIFKMSQQKNNPLTATHHPVGLKAQFMFKLSGMSPQFINRWTNILLSHRNE